MKSRLESIKDNIKVINALNEKSNYELVMVETYLKECYYNMCMRYDRGGSFEGLVLLYKDQYRGITQIQELCDKYLLKIK